jgi:hypothetical protein
VTVHLVCGDALNATNRPTPAQLRDLGADGVRMVHFDSPEYAHYYADLRNADLWVATVLSGESFPHQQPRAAVDYAAHVRRIAQQFATFGLGPDIWVLGNEPSAARGAASSWEMPPPVYREFVLAVAPEIRTVFPEARLHAGGMLGWAGWLDPIWEDIAPWIDGLDVHYPANEESLRSWERYERALSCLEWAWAGATVPTSDVVAWQQMLDRWCTATSWFCWSWAGEAELSLLNPATGAPSKAYADYQAAIKA